ncbi:unannotated protein [freshwater metagenome]|uniref:Unannotated protein n=1 Tax=freshwater metagenome TaxID=449393 RepID=A0A6J6H714_9ZZZZ
MIVFGFFTFAVAFGVIFIVILQLPALIPRTPLFGETTEQIDFELDAMDRTTFEPEGIVVPAFEAILLAEIDFPFLTPGVDWAGVDGDDTGATAVVPEDAVPPLLEPSDDGEPTDGV